MHTARPWHVWFSLIDRDTMVRFIEPDYALLCSPEAPPLLIHLVSGDAKLILMHESDVLMKVALGARAPDMMSHKRDHGSDHQDREHAGRLREQVNNAAEGQHHNNDFAE